WPPSNPRLNLKPDRDFAPLCPRLAVFPDPDPWPRPMRFFACFIPLGGRRLLRPICWLPTIGELVNWRMGECTHQFTTSPILQLICHLYQVPHLVDHAPHGRRVLQHDRVADPAQAEPADHRPLVALEPDRAFDERHLHGAALAVCS